jgi:hypothetical protein
VSPVLPDVLYEARIEPDTGFYLSTGKRWSGYRVRYRVAGTYRGRWRTFLLVEHDQPPTVEQIQRLCHAHATGDPA